ncbi:hypothetical protein [Brevundimonas sp.]|uniref:hypothetical protein n=1 Tax=Brevundimonas sp. TaxID=1871086 RepID=UPI00272C34E1|nr:hypothetical protein [Brevundimonas sp.]
MTTRIHLRPVTPLGWGLAVALMLGAALLIGHGLGFRWDPFGLAETRLKAAQGRAGAAADDAAARRLEIEGAIDLAGRIDRHHQRAAAVERATARSAAEARNAHDAATPLDPYRAARLTGHDRELCRLAPAVCTAAAPDPADRGDDAM